MIAGFHTESSMVVIFSPCRGLLVYGPRMGITNAFFGVCGRFGVSQLVAS